MKRKISIYFGLALVLALSMGLTMSLLNQNAGPDTAEAGALNPFTGFGFGVKLTNTLQSFDQDGDDTIANADAAANEVQTSGYDFTIKSDLALEGNTTFETGTITITFRCDVTDRDAACDKVAGNSEAVDLSALNGERVQVGDENLVDTDIVLAKDIGTDEQGNPTLTLRLGAGMDADGGNDSDNIIEAGENINIVIPEGFVQNPSTDSENYGLQVEMNNDEGAIESAKYSFGPRVSLSPEDPGSSTRVTFDFFVSNMLVANDGQLRFQFDKEWKNIPSDMSANRITMRADRVLGTDLTLCDAASSAPCSNNQVVNPFEDPTFDVVGSENRDTEITVRIGDMDPSTSDTTGVGNQGIAEGALVSLSFSNRAGINVPSEAENEYGRQGSKTDEIDVFHTNAGGTFIKVGEAEPRPPRVLELDNNDGTLGSMHTLVGKGFKGGQSVTIFVDSNSDGEKDPGESDLLTGVPVEGDDTFTAKFTVTSAILAGGKNWIQVEDGEGNGACRFVPGSAGRCTGLDNAAEFELKGRVEVSPSTAARGDTITITLEDWSDEGGTLLSASIGGAAIDIPANTPVVSGNALTFKTTVPNDAPLGNGVLLVVTTDTDENTDFTVTGATLNLALTEAVPNQSLTFNGTGFTDTGTVVVCERNITIADNREIVFDPDETTRTLAAKLGSCERGDTVIDVTSGGTFVATVTIPVNSQTLRDGVAHEVKVIDSAGREGTESLLFPARSMTVTPLECGTRCVIEVTGTGFPADNDDGASVDISVEYDCGVRCSNSESVDPDTAGRFIAQLEVPSRAPIPSDNTITAIITTSGSPDRADDGVQTPRPTVKHFIPEAQVELTVARGPSGTIVDVTGSFFSAFTSVERIEFGGLNALGGHSPNTDSSGGFSVEGLTVPDLDEGIHSVIVRVGTDDREVTANTVYEVTSRGLIGVPSTAAEALAPLTDDNLLERAFFFDNSTKVWSFYDPRPEFVDANTIDEFFSGGVYWVKVTADTEPILNGQTRNLICVNAGTPEEDCWSLLVW
jgi:hypothetical protein